MSKLKKSFFVLIAIIFIVVVIPFIIIYNICGFYDGEKNDVGQIPQITDSTVIKVYIAKEDKVEEMNINDYLMGVVSAEIPASFNEEALKAQAVAARSYLVYHMNSYEKNGTPENHKGADVCTDYRHCQAWMSEADRRASWDAKDADANWEKIKSAVLATSGEVMTYNGDVINAVFHSTSSGKTENAADVWGSDIPYLKSVDSSGDKEAPKYNSENSFTADEFKTKAESVLGGLDWSKGLFSNIERSNAGGITSITIGGKTIKGTKFREIYGIRSTNVQISESDGKVIMSVHGYGHGVGMSQYGANYLAESGKNYKEILKAYYTGVDIVKK